MTVKDIKTSLDVIQSLTPAARTATATGTAADLQGYDSAMVLVSVGTCTDGTHTPSLEHSVDGVSYAAVTAGDLLGSFTAITSGAGAASVQRVGYVGERRYLRVVMTVTGATTGAVYGADILRGSPHRRPL